MKISEICDYGMKSNIKAGEGLSEGVYRFFTSSSEVNKFINEVQFTKPGIIMGTGGNVTLHYCEEPFSVSTDCLVLFPQTKVKTKYLFYFLKGNFHILQLGFKGAGLKHTSKKYISKISLNYIPDKNEQEQIIEKLDTIQKIINSKRQQLAEYDQLIKSQFVEMFGDPNVNSRDFQKVPLGDIAFITKLAGFEYTDYIEYKNEGPIIMVRGLNCKKGKLVLDNVYYESKEISDSLPRSKLFKGDIAFTYVGTIAQCALIDEDNRYHLAPNVAKISLLDKNKNKPEFFTNLFVHFRDYIVSFSTATSQSKLSMMEIRKIPFILPPTHLQTKFVEFYIKVDKLKSVVQQSLNETQQLFDSLMQEYFG